MLNINKKKFLKNSILKDHEIMDLILNIELNKKDEYKDLTERYYLKYINSKYETNYKSFKEIINEVLTKKI